MNSIGFSSAVPVLLKSKAAAELLQISERKLWSLQNAGDIPSLHIGRSVRFRLVDLETYAERLAKEGK